MSPLYGLFEAVGAFFSNIWQSLLHCRENPALLIFLLAVSPILFLSLRNLFWNAARGLRNLMQPVVITPAKVLSRREQKVQNRWQKLWKNYRYLGRALEATRFGYLYYVTFRLEDGTTKELQVWGDIYAGVQEGDYGVLTFRGEKFKSFRMSTMNAQRV